jgi:hypothetical protein
MSQKTRPCGAAGEGFGPLRTYATGKEILVLGPSSAGKSKFAEYLQLGRLHPEGERR